MCNPEHSVSLTVGRRPALDDAVLEEVEREAGGAFIQRTGSLTLQVMGSDLVCTLAMSMLEQTYRFIIISDGGGGALGGGAEVEGENKPTATGKTKEEEEEDYLDLTPTEVMIGVKDMVMDSGRGHPQPASVEDDAQLFGPGKGTPPHPDPTRALSSPSRQKAALNTASTHTAGKMAGRTFPGEGGEAGEESADVLKRKSELQSIGLGMGYSQEDIDDALPFFDLSQERVDLGDFLTALDNVHTSRREEEEEEEKGSPSKQAGKHSPGNPTTDQCKGPGKGKQKARKKNKQAKKTQATAVPSGNQPSAAGKSPGKKVGTVSPKQNPSLAADKSVVVAGEREDSYILVSDDDNVCLVDSSPVWAGKRDFPGSPHLPEAVRKRRDLSDDRDQTKVLKPFPTALPYAGSGTTAGRQISKQEWGQAAETATSAYPSAAAAASSSDVATANDNSDMRFIVIDGSNVAMAHGNDRVFSCRGIQICVDHFVRRGHRVKVWVPLTKTYQKQAWHLPPVVHQEILDELKERGYLGYTPARTLNKKHFVSHDDPFILDLAQKEDAVIVSNDNFSEFVTEYAFIIENRVLSYVFSDDHFMLPRDPLGRNGPSLEQFLRKFPLARPHRPFAKAGTSRPGPLNFGTPAALKNAPVHRHPPPKCNAFLPPSQQPRARSSNRNKLRGMPLGARAPRPASLGPPAGQPEEGAPTRHGEVTDWVFKALKGVFPDAEQEDMIRRVLDNHPSETDLNKLTNYCIAALDV
ncbi:hypothetical protein ACOMHN_045201 [Nucella lapillus]